MELKQVGSVIHPFSTLARLSIARPQADQAECFLFATFSLGQHHGGHDDGKRWAANTA